MAGFATAGLLLKGTNGTSQTIPGTQSITGSGADKPLIEVTALSDTSRQYLSGMPGLGEFAFDIAWDPAHAMHAWLSTQYESSSATPAFNIICPDSGSADIAFSGPLTKRDFNFGRDDFGKLSFAVRVNSLTITP